MSQFFALREYLKNIVYGKLWKVYIGEISNAKLVYRNQKSDQ